MASALFVLLAIALATGWYVRRSRPASPRADPARVETLPPLAAPATQSTVPASASAQPGEEIRPARADDAADAGMSWESAGPTTVDGKAMRLEKRGNERMLRRDDGSPFEQYAEIGGLREGLSTRWYPSGNVQSIGEWHAGSRHGSWTDFQEDGSVTQRGNYALGRREGEWESLYPNGTLRWRGSYQHDRQVGEWMFVTPEGLVDVVHNGPLEDARQGGK
ncbi:MAG: hypothetical protein ABIP42_19285 [Planctomycetota bacterium]